MVQIQTSFGGQGGDGIRVLQQIIQDRMKYLNETARDSISATAINILKSLRTITKVAKPSKVKVEVQVDSNLTPSVYTEGGDKSWRKSKQGKVGIRKTCLRITGSKQRYYGSEKVIWTKERVPIKILKAFRYTYEKDDKKTNYIIVAQSVSQAREYAKKIAGKKVITFAGLAKRALSLLMFKTNTMRSFDDSVSPKANKKADEVTNKRELLAKSKVGGIYTLELNDELRYAQDAIKGGRSQVDIQMKKASNKIVSMINQKLKYNSFFSNQKLPTPFPEVRQRR